MNSSLFIHISQLSDFLCDQLNGGDPVRGTKGQFEHETDLLSAFNTQSP